MHLTKDIDSLSNFKRKTPDFVARMKKKPASRSF